MTQKLVFVSGKGGVGKTAVSQALALSLSKKGLRTLWTTFEDPMEPSTQIRRIGDGLWHLNCDATEAFEEYAGLKIGMPRITRIFLENKLTRYLAKAAPGIHELVLLGKVWHECENYDHVIVDMPSTGYGLAMFQSTINFSRLFRGGPIHRDADAMLGTFRNPNETGHLIVSLPEEMPLRESLELDVFLRELFPANRAVFVVNRRFPRPKALGAPGAEDTQTAPPDWKSPLAADARDYAAKRAQLERHNLRLWEEAKIAWLELDYVPPTADQAGGRSLVDALSAQLDRRGLPT